MGAMKALFTEMQMDMLASAEVLITASNSSGWRKSSAS